MNTEEVLLEWAEEYTEEVKKQEYKALMHWRASENALGIIKHCEETAEALLLKIKEELEKRKLPKLEYSEVNELNSFINFMVSIKNKIDDSEGWMVIKREFEKGIQNGLTHLYSKADIGFDVPAFTKLDMIKKLRNLNTTMQRRFDEVVNSFAPEKKKEEVLHPYEEQ